MNRGSKDQKSTKPASASSQPTGESETGMSAKGEELFRRLLKVRNLPMTWDKPPEKDGV